GSRVHREQASTVAACYRGLVGVGAARWQVLHPGAMRSLLSLRIQKPGAPDTLLRMRSAPLGIRVKRRRASFISTPVVFTHSCRMASARGSMSIGTPKALATQAAVMSLRV